MCVLFRGFSTFQMEILSFYQFRFEVAIMKQQQEHGDLTFQMKAVTPHSLFYFVSTIIEATRDLVRVQYTSYMYTVHKLI